MNTVDKILGAAGPPQVSKASPPVETLRKAGKVLGWTVERIAALLIVIEICVLFSGVIARYVLHRPLIWTDEVTSILFLWLASLGRSSPSGGASTCG